MKICLYFTLIFILSFQSLCKLDIAWTKFYTNGIFPIIPKGIHITNSSYNEIYVLLCISDEDNKLSNHLLKFDTQGNQIYNKQLDNELKQASAFIIVNDSIFIIGTSTSNVGTFTNKGGTDIYVGKFNPLNGNLVQKISYGSDQDDIPYFISNYLDDLYILGETYGNIVDINKGGKDVFLTKIDINSFNYEWTKLIGTEYNDSAISLSSQNNQIFVILELDNVQFIQCYNPDGILGMNTNFKHLMKEVIFDNNNNPYLISEIDHNGAKKLVFIKATTEAMNSDIVPYKDFNIDIYTIKGMFDRFNNIYFLNNIENVCNFINNDDSLIIGIKGSNYGRFSAYDRDMRIYVLGTSSSGDYNYYFFITKICSSSCEKIQYNDCTDTCSSNEEICFSNKCVKKELLFDPSAPVPPAPVPPAPVPPAPVPPAPVPPAPVPPAPVPPAPVPPAPVLPAPTSVTNKKEKVFDLTTSSANSEEFINHIEKVNLYSADSFDTTSITLNLDYRAITINLKLYVFSKETTLPNDSSVTINLKINDVEVDFEENYDIITYPKLEPFINSNDINYSILSLNHVYLHNENINTLSLKITNSDPNKYKVYATLIQLNASICHSRCEECDQNTFNCLSCYDAIYSSSNNCQCPQDKPSATYEDNYESVICNTSVEADLCQKYSLNSNGFTSCLECKGSTFKTYDNFINPLCKCKSGFIWTGKDDMSKECYSYLEATCSDYDSTSLNIKAINTWLTTKDNLQMNISDEVEPIYDEVYFNLQLSPKPFPTDESLNIGKDIAFKISILKGSDDVSNILYLSKWSNNLSDGININKNDLQKGLYDCETKTISNNSKVYTCKISIYAFNPCKSFIYMNTIAKVKIGDGGVIESEISIDANGQSNINIPCLNNNTCFFNEKFSNTIMICDKLPCLQTRSSPFAPGDVLNIKPTLSVTDGNPDKYTQSIETAAFIIKNSKGEETGKFDVSQDFKLTTENGKKIFGFIIPAAGSLMTKSGYLEGANVSFNIIFKVDESLRRVLQTDAQNGYSLIPPLNIKIEIDPEYLQGGSKYQDLISENRINTLIVIFSCIISTLLVGIILYCYIKNRLNNKMKNNIVYDKANAQGDKFNSNGSDKNEMNENNNIEDIDVKI